MAVVGAVVGSVVGAVVGAVVGLCRIFSLRYGVFGKITVDNDGGKTGDTGNRLKNVE